MIIIIIISIFYVMELVWSNKEEQESCMSDPFPLSIPVILIGSLLMIFLGSDGKNHQKPEWTSASGQTEPD